MKKAQLLTSLLMVSGAFALVACGGGDKKPADQAAAGAAPTAPPPLINTIQKIKDSGKVVVGHRESSTPISYVVDGKPVGYAMDICAGVVEQIKKDLNMPKSSPKVAVNSL